MSDGGGFGASQNVDCVRERRNNRVSLVSPCAGPIFSAPSQREAREKKNLRQWTKSALLWLHNNHPAR